MRWYYKKIEFNNNLYIYAYSHEDKAYDGVIEYNNKTQEGKVIKPCKDDIGSIFAQDWSYSNFYKVIRENFPDERAVITG